MCGATRDVRFGPKADMACLLDHLVCASEHRRRNCETKRLGRFEIDCQLVFGRRLHRQVARLLALEDAINIPSRASALVDHIGSDANQTAASNEVTERVHGRQLVASRERDDLITRRRRARRYD